MLEVMSVCIVVVVEVVKPSLAAVVDSDLRGLIRIETRGPCTFQMQINPLSPTFFPTQKVNECSDPELLGLTGLKSILYELLSFLFFSFFSASLPCSIRSMRQHRYCSSARRLFLLDLL